MSDYPLKDFATFTEYAGRRVGLLIRCPNCGVACSVWFRVPIGGGENPFVKESKRPLWDRTGDDLETVTLHPSLKMFDHFHSWIRNGKLEVDSPFECKRP
jgi:Family of unknown function (DUF6527)